MVRTYTDVLRTPDAELLRNKDRVVVIGRVDKGEGDIAEIFGFVFRNRRRRGSILGCLGWLSIWIASIIYRPRKDPLWGPPGYCPVSPSPC